jgi:hypothetical protein
MVYFQTNLGNCLRALDWKLLIYFMTIWNILRTFVIFYGYLEYFTDIWDILRPFGTFCVHLVHTFFRFTHELFLKYFGPMPLFRFFQLTHNAY